jgi:hypothetical protein
MPITDDERKRADELIARLETATGQVLLRDEVLMPIITAMREDLRALRALLGVERPH